MRRASGQSEQVSNVSAGFANIRLAISAGFTNAGEESVSIIMKSQGVEFELSVEIFVTSRTRTTFSDKIAELLLFAISTFIKL